MRTPPPTIRAATEVTHDDEATEVERYLGGWFSVDEPSDFDRELDDDARRRVGDGSHRHVPRFATGTGQFDLRSGEPRESPDSMDESLVDAASAPLSLIMAHKVSCVRQDLDASEARSRILARGVSGLPVVDNWGRAVGVISKTDLVEHAVGGEASGLQVVDIMTPLVFSLTPEDSIGRAAALMAYEGVHRVVVVDKSGYVVGLVSSLDVARWLGRRAGHPVGQEG
jgi:CBS domain-containing protein